MKPEAMAKAIEELRASVEAQQQEINELIGRVSAQEELISELTHGKKRGPKVERAMTDEDAFRVKFGDLKKPMSHRDAAEQLGLSYGQVFSARGGYTFKHVKADWKPPVKAETTEAQNADDK